jgi:hypothetical protein
LDDQRARRSRDYRLLQPLTKRGVSDAALDASSSSKRARVRRSRRRLVGARTASTGPIALTGPAEARRGAEAIDAGAETRNRYELLEALSQESMNQTVECRIGRGGRAPTANPVLSAAGSAPAVRLR